MERDMLTIAEVAKELGITTQAVHKRLAAGRIQGEQVNPRLWLIPRAEVDREKMFGRLKPGPKPGAKRKAETVPAGPEPT